MAGGSNEPGRSVLSKALSVLEAFENDRRALTQSQIVEITGLPQSTVHRLLAELVEWGALSRDVNGRYQIGMRLWELGQNAGRQLREIARPFVLDLYSLTRETAQIAVRDGTDALYIDRAYSSKRVPRASRVGGRLPLHATAVGKVLLAYEEDWVRDAYLQQELKAVTPHTHVSPRRLAEELEVVRGRGWAVTAEEMRLGACSIAVPVHHREGRVGAALGLVMASNQAATMTRHLPTMQGVARQIEAATAHVPLNTIRRVADPRSGVRA
ncbi:IclR family transcriptional regulator [Kocuria sp. M4R2S49]|uniref:IclR family transcriptional regulator n=1 Tax=Kocuria rhizosphaericola TaxID=3376284 RepID=UPI0037ACC582